MFDEARYFTPGDLTDPLELYVIGGVRVGVTICEDAWSPNGPIAMQAAGGAELVVNINASPYAMDKVRLREKMLATRAADASCALVYVNQVGGQDELVFDGASMVFDAEGELVAQGATVRGGPAGRRPRGRCHLPQAPARPPRPGDAGRSAGSRRQRPAGTYWRGSRLGGLAPLRDHVSEVYDAIVLGLRDYAWKNGFRDVVLGLSGGIDSSLVAVIAAEALGAEHVHGVSMPSRYSSDGSRSDAEAVAEALGCGYRTIPIEPAFAAFLDLLAPSFVDREADLTEENLQSRIRGMLLMALSNKFGWLVLTTGNKSEMAVGYSTLYGDSAGGFAVIKDVYKTTVYRLCRHVNDVAGREIIPEAVLTKAPSAELRPDQRDDQSLPPYDVLDAILKAYVEDDRTAAEIVAAGRGRGRRAAHHPPWSTWPSTSAARPRPA